MPSLKDLKNRIDSVKSTRKITKAMQMVAAAKLKRAQERAEAARPYATRMEQVVRALAESVKDSPNAPKLLAGTGKDDTHLIIVATADRGLCGGFNSSIVRAAKERIMALQGEGKSVRLLFVGRKGYDQLKSTYSDLTAKRINDLTKKKVLAYTDAKHVGDEVLRLIEEEAIDTVTLIYNRFKSAISQEVTFQQLMPLELEAADENASEGASAIYEYEPEEEVILADLLPRNITVQIYRAMLENIASEQGARMSAMDNATRNAGDMIDKLTLQYNRSRQAAITTELVEIISGAEAL